MPVRVAVSDDQVLVEVSGWASVWSLRDGFAVPRREVWSAAAVPRADAGRPPWLRWPGTAVPGLVIAGTYLTKGRTEFWYVRRAARVLVLRFGPHAPYTRAVLEVDDPDAVAAALR